MQVEPGTLIAMTRQPACHGDTSYLLPPISYLLPFYFPIPFRSSARDPLSALRSP
jgi:hypothetical protein